MRFTDKVVAITGGSRGFGEAFAQRFAEEGALVSICARDVQLLQNVAGKIEEKGGKVQWIACDITKPEGIKEFVKATFDRFVVSSSSGEAPEMQSLID